GGGDPGGVRPHRAAGRGKHVPLRRPVPRGSAAPGGGAAGRLPGRGPARPARARVGRGKGLAPGRARQPPRFPSTRSLIRGRTTSTGSEIFQSVAPSNGVSDAVRIAVAAPP